MRQALAPALGPRGWRSQQRRRRLPAATFEDLPRLPRRLREFRAAPKRVAALVPPALIAAEPDGDPLRSFVEALVGAAQHKAAALGERAHATAELISAQKVAAVAESTAALAGGGTAVDQFANHQGRHRLRRPPTRSRPSR